MTITIMDRIFWLRAALGVFTGAISQFLFGTDYQTGILLAITIYLASYYVVKRIWGPKVKPDEMRKLYTAGLPSYVLLFLFFYILLFTVGLHSLHL
jgi:hypothetical protein